MKITYKILPLLLVIFSLASCDDFLTQESASTINTGEFWQSPSEARQGVAAIYDEAQSNFSDEILTYGELRSDNFHLIESGPPTSLIELVSNELSPTTVDSWGGFYTAISTANLAIQNITNMSDFEGKDGLLAQAHALRSLFYFWAVRIWGDIPMITEPILEFKEEYNITRAPSNEIFTEIIIPDLETAEQLVSNPRNQHEMSLGAILALKAHVNAWPGSHQDHSVTINTITQLEGLGYSLETTEQGWIDIFRGSPQNSDEMVFALEWNFETDGNNGVVHEFSNVVTWWSISSDLRQAWDPNTNDYRRDASFVELDENAPTDPYLLGLNKYSGEYARPLVRHNWSISNELDLIFYRLSGLLLLKAEAENYMDNPGTALALVNRVRTARGLNPVDETITDQNTVRDIILEERQFELLGEGHRFWDLVRNGVATDVMEPIDDERTILWPVSQEVLDRNPNISQTEVYN